MQEESNKRWMDGQNKACDDEDYSELGEHVNKTLFYNHTSINVYASVRCCARDSHCIYTRMSGVCELLCRPIISLPHFKDVIFCLFSFFFISQLVVSDFIRAPMGVVNITAFVGIHVIRNSHSTPLTLIFNFDDTMSFFYEHKTNYAR